MDRTATTNATDPATTHAPLFPTFPPAEDLYPETDGRPMGETDIHMAWMWKIKQIFLQRYRGQNVYVASDLLLYYQEGVPARYIVPDVFVTLHCDPSMRRVYKTWVDGGPPQLVIEVTSKSTRREDELFKPTTYRNIGVQEYILYDPTADYLHPPLQGHRLNADGLYDPIEWVDGRLPCRSLGVDLSLDGRDLVITDAETGQPQWMREDVEAAARKEEQRLRQEEQRLRQEEQRRRETAEARVAELEAELRRIRGET